MYTQNINLVQPIHIIGKRERSIIQTETHLGDVVVLAEGLELGIELINPIFVALVCQFRHLLGEL